MSLPLITGDGHRFISQGKPWPYVGLSEFALFKRFLVPDADGWTVLVEPILAERRAAARAGGWGDRDIVLRVFRYAGNNNAFAIEPWSYQFSAITDFTQRCNALGFRIHWTCGDAQLVLPNPHGPTGQQQHLNQMCAALVPCGTNFLATVNEPFKNGIDVSVVKPPSWGQYLRDSGHYELDHPEQWDHSLDLDFLSIHPERGSKGHHPYPGWLKNLYEGAAVALNDARVRGRLLPLVEEEPIGFKTGAPPDGDNSRYGNPEHAFKVGQCVSWFGITFHSTIGLSSDGYDTETRTAAEAFFAGAAGAWRS